MWSFFRKHQNVEEHVIIHPACYDKLPPSHRKAFSWVAMPEGKPLPPATHAVIQNGTSFTLGLIAGMAGSSLVIPFADDTWQGAQPTPEDKTTSFGGFGQGEGGGAGAGGSWQDPGQTVPDPPAGPLETRVPEVPDPVESIPDQPADMQ